MGETTLYRLPFPEPPDPADVPTDMHELADRIELVFSAGALFAAVSTVETVAASGAWGNLATDGPAITIPTAGDYIAVASCSTQNLGIAQRQFAVAVGNTDPAGNVAICTSAGWGSLALASLFTGLSAGAVLKHRYWSADPAGQFGFRSLLLIPRKLL